MRINLLGPFEVRSDDDTVVDVPGARSRALLAALALEPGRVVPKARLADWIWGEQSPADEINALQVLVSRLRRTLPAGLIEAKSGGYRLVVEPDTVDVTRFDRLVDDARSADDPTRADLLGAALDLWRGEPFEGIELLGSKAFDAAVAGLTERRLATVGDRVDVRTRLGHAADLVPELTDLVAANPLRESFVAALMRALAESGRGTEALTAYQRLRERLDEELGVDPSAALSALHTALLRGEIGGRAENPPTNLRTELTDFVGDDTTVTAIAASARDNRLVTLTGAGGLGKTRLATEAVRTMLGDQPDGVWLVELAALRTGAELAQAVLTAVGLRDPSLLGAGPDGDAADRLVTAIRDKAMLLVLDNCEHLIDQVSAFADRLLGQCRALRIVATSREPLGITGEVLWQVAPLAVPADTAGPDAIAASPAVRLLRDRAAAVRHNIGTDPATLSTMAHICRALDGMPLAIELAAARLRTMSVGQLADRLDDRFRLLTGGSRTALPRHRTLRAVVDWSWDLLSDAERDLLCRLSVFAGGASLAAAEQVSADPEQTLDLLTALTEKSLLIAYGDNEPRYRMLDTIRQYAATRLLDTGQDRAARTAHLDHVTALVETADPLLRSAAQLDSLAVLETEHDNLTAALRGAIADRNATAAMRLVGAAGWYWFLAGRKAEGTALATAAAALPGEVPDRVRALAYAVATMLVTSGHGSPEQAEEWIRWTPRSDGPRHPLVALIEPLRHMASGPEAFLAGYQDLLTDDDPWVRAQARLNRGRFRLDLGHDPVEAEADIATALTELRAVGERWSVSLALSTQADRFARRGELRAAADHYEQAITALSEVGAVEDVIAFRARQAQLHQLAGDPTAADRAMAEAIRRADGINWPDAIADLTLARARIARWRGETDRARALLDTVDILGDRNPRALQALAQDLAGYLATGLDESRSHRAEAFRAAVDVGYPPLDAQILVGLADLALRRDDPEAAAGLLAAGDERRGGPDRSEPEAARIAAAARERLGDQAFAAAAERGRQCDWPDLARTALAD